MNAGISNRESPAPVAVEPRFVSEAITPIAFGAPAAIGEPATPVRFRWRGQEHEVARVIEKWKTTGACRNGSGEIYVRRHWYRLETSGGVEMEIYFERQPRSKQTKKRWWVARLPAPNF
jgi:hypothetical protein